MSSEEQLLLATSQCLLARRQRALSSPAGASWQLQRGFLAPAPLLRGSWSALLSSVQLDHVLLCKGTHKGEKKQTAAPPGAQAEERKQHSAWLCGASRSAAVSCAQRSTAAHPSLPEAQCPPRSALGAAGGWGYSLQCLCCADSDYLSADICPGYCSRVPTEQQPACARWP